MCMSALSVWKMYNDQNPNEAQVFYLPIHGEGLPLADNFTLKEFKSPDSDFVLVHPALVALLQTVRDHFGVPVGVNSAYRTREHNASVGGADESKHLLGMAADIVVSGVEPEEVYDYLENYDPGGLGLYDTFTHVDIFGVMRRWDERS